MTGFASDDLAAVPFFEVSLVGRGTVHLILDRSAEGTTARK